MSIYAVFRMREEINQSVSQLVSLPCCAVPPPVKRGSWGNIDTQGHSLFTALEVTHNSTKIPCIHTYEHAMQRKAYDRACMRACVRASEHAMHIQYNTIQYNENELAH